jgi:hypothetical protein
VTKIVGEIAWDWAEIAVVMMWKLCPKGLVLTRADMGRLPQDRVMIEDRGVDDIRFRWMRPQDARAYATRLKKATGERAGVSQLQGRWQKLGVVLLWKLTRDEGLVLTRADRTAVPGDQKLLTRGTHDAVEFRFIPTAEAIRIAKWERDNEGKIVVEGMEGPQ